jgi:DNA repair protein RadD
MTDSFMSKRFKSGKFDIWLIDECSLVSNDPNSKYRRIERALKAANPKIMILGVDGSPYRAGQGDLFNPCFIGDKVEKPLFTTCAYRSDIKYLIQEGFLSHIVVLNSDIEADMTGVKKDKNGEFLMSEVGVKIDRILEPAINDIKHNIIANNIETSITFVPTLAVARRALELWGSDKVRIVCGDAALKHERKAAIKWFKESKGERHLINVYVLVRGFDFKKLDLVNLLVATTSLQKYVQCVGRVIRAHAEKENGFLSDYGGNIARHGHLDNLNLPKPKLKKEAPTKKPCTFELPSGVECGHWNHLNAKICVKCGAYFNYGESEEGLYSMLSEAQVLQLERINSRQEYDVTSVLFDRVMSSAGNDSVVAKYYYDGGMIKKWLCFDNAKAQNMAKAWLREALVDFRHYIELQQSGEITTENVYLLTQQAPEYFQVPTKIIVQNQKDSNKYKEIYKIIY